MENSEKIFEQYMEMTGDSFTYILSGAFAFGPEFVNNLVKEAVAKRKRIIWIDESQTKGNDAMNYRLEDID